ncbi:MAG: endonuclease [Flavobacteriaceae bacterium]|nr:endonuclease [Flavobacteriaceae bacterium]
MADREIKNSDYFTVAFYNLENLFDTFDDQYTNDNDFLPKSEKHWTEKRYRKKIRKLGYAISRIGRQTAKKHPTIVGLAEVENKLVIKDLLESKALKEYNYRYVHYDSPDERGIDVALIYDADVFKVMHSEVFSLNLYDEDGNRDYTRDILLVKGKLKNEKIYILVNHWPSRHSGEELTEPHRILASNKVLEIIDIIKSKDSNAKIIVMGDFNDGPYNKSVKQLVNKEDFYNPMESLKSYTRGSVNHRLEWYLFDQILFSTNFFEIKQNSHTFSKANIFDSEFLKQYKGKYKGGPFRTYVGLKYKGGYSDHFPVYIHLKRIS